MQLAHELASRSVALRFEDLPGDAVHWAKVGILDTVGVTVAGSVEPCARIVGRMVPPGRAQASCSAPPTARAHSTRH